jgi:hypothetical protein
MYIVAIHQIPTSLRDFIFEPYEEECLSFFTHILNPLMYNVLIKNNTSRLVKISCNQRLGRIHKLDIEQGIIASAFLADREDMISLVERPPKKSQLE